MYSDNNKTNNIKIMKTLEKIYDRISWVLFGGIKGIFKR
ncbi:hypothetical protein PHG11b_8 [Flavobacterium phage 11b]|nr:hypothetical protein PHG11b_8 [Flavobacterium phage 11b]CAH56635.1 hypothetical protein PHG11b_8 [Flavobacterium phage 11b]